MKVYVTRHGESQFNVQNRVCGMIDADLTEKGVAQAEALARELSGLGIRLVISSPLRRAKRTADILATAAGLPVLEDFRLCEINYGELEGSSRDEEPYLSLKNKFATRMPGGESMFDVVQRVFNFLDEATETYKDLDILLVCHGGTYKAINAYFSDVTDEAFYRNGIGNCHLACFEV